MTASTTWRIRAQICCTAPHIASFTSFIILALYIVLTVRAENKRQRQAHLLADRAAFVYLADDLPALTRSLISFNRNLHLPMSYKLLILHDSLTPSAQGRFQALSEAPITFRRLSTPHNYSLVQNLSVTRFWSVTALLNDPSATLADVDYIIRLSSRATFTTPMKRDFVKDFVAHGAQYGYHDVTTHCNNTKLRHLATSYVDLNGIQPRCDALWKRIRSSDCLPAFAGAFEVINLRFFRSHSGIQAWLRVVDADDAILQWHEGLIRYITVALYAAPDKVTKFDNQLPFRLS